ncbi:hypothetical protein, partial [Vibrio alginolyticus]|uniref:hypothetical protein n=1 Tax=Vibrio alginolyticus TaxID=663 RepID=UPI00197FA052
SHLNAALSVFTSKETKLARKPLIEHVFNELVDLSKQFWQVSLFATILFIVLTLFAVKFAVGVLNGVESGSPTNIAIINSIGWVFYLVPIVFGMITVFFGVNTLKGYVESKYT